MRPVHLVVPDGVDDPSRPSGGNTYDLRLRTGLAELGWDVRMDVVAAESGCGPAVFSARALAAVLARVPDRHVALLDGLVASGHPEVLREHADRLRLVLLVHLPLGLAGPDGGCAELRDREAAAVHHVAAVVATSRWTRRWLVDTYRLDPARIVAAVPGVDLSTPAAGAPSGRRLLCVGAVIPAKGHDVLLEALAGVRAADWSCACVGSLERDPVFVEQLRARATALGIADRVRFPGPLTGADLAAAYRAADLLVTATRGETYGMVVTEALAHGIPVVATRVGGLPEALGHVPGGRRPGILVPAGNRSALAGALDQWLGDPRLRAHLRRAAVDRRPTLPTWAATSSEVSRVLAAVSA